jgi:hypothetical protein|tara:strand:- start:415 stop:837 length:423 start_codon:yes stop_codon:yes gene_type:complete
MADVVTGPTILRQTDNRLVVKYVNVSDGSGGTTIIGDVSALTARTDGAAVAHLSILQVWFSCQGGDGGDSYLRIDEEDNDGDIPMLALTGNGYFDFRSFGGITADKSTNTNESDVQVIVPGAADDGNAYSLIVEFEKVYG